MDLLYAGSPMRDVPEKWPRGFEIELMAPKGSSREVLAKRLASAVSGGTTRRIFYPQSEISTRPNVPGYETLTLGFQVVDGKGRTFALLADDITLNDDIDHDVEGMPGWYRILTPHRLIVDLALAHCSAEATIDDVLGPVAELYGTTVVRADGGCRAVRSRSGMVAMAFPLAGERERACEIISPPLGGDDAFLRRYLTTVLSASQELGFIVPKESATHIHYDGDALMNVAAIWNLVRIFTRFQAPLKTLSETNPSCTRLGPWPKDFLDLVLAPSFLDRTWPDAARAMNGTSVAKWCDFNVLNLFDPFATKRTFEVRILKTSFDFGWLVDRSNTFETLLRRAVLLPPLPPSTTADGTHETLHRFLEDGRW